MKRQTTENKSLIKPVRWQMLVQMMSRLYLNEARRVLESVPELLWVLSQGTRLMIQLIQTGRGKQHHLHHKTSHVKYAPKSNVE